MDTNGVQNPYKNPVDLASGEQAAIPRLNAFTLVHVGIVAASIGLDKLQQAVEPNGLPWHSTTLLRISALILGAVGVIWCIRALIQGIMPVTISVVWYTLVGMHLLWFFGNFLGFMLSTRG